MAEPEFTIVVVDPDLVWRTELSNAIAPHDVVDVPSLAGALSSLPSNGSAGLFVGPNAAPEVLPQVADLRRQRPGLLVVLVFESVSVELLREAMQAGVYDVLDASAERELLARSLAEAVRELEGGHERVEQAAEAVRPATLVVVTTAKGGEGVTAVSTNLAAALAGAGHSVALVDGDQRFGDVALVMGFDAPPLGNGFDELGASRQAVLEAVREHAPTGLMVLVPPRSTAPAAAVSEQRFLEVISAVQAIAQVVVVDAPFALVEEADLWGYADRVLMVCDLDATALKNTMIGARILARGGATAGLELVLNRIPAGTEPDPAELQEVVGIPLLAWLPAADGMSDSLASGTPYVIEHPETAFSAAVRSLAEVVATAAAP
jgi:MinD-like ATPase involved in chromosome partitioning or flagellar assembly